MATRLVTTVSTTREPAGMTAIMLDNKPQLEETQGRTMEQHTTIVRAEPPLCKHKYLWGQ